MRRVGGEDKVEELETRNEREVGKSNKSLYMEIF